MATQTVVLDDAFLQFRSTVYALWRKPNNTVEVASLLQRLWVNELSELDHRRISEVIGDLLEADERRTEITEPERTSPRWPAIEQAFSKPPGSLTPDDIKQMRDYIAVCKAVKQVMLQYLASMAVFQDILVELGLEDVTRTACEDQVRQHKRNRNLATLSIKTLVEQLERHGVAVPEFEQRWVVVKSLDDRKVELQVLYNGNGNLIDRRVVKKEKVSEEEWNSPRYWKQPQLGGPTIPNEYYLQRKCWDAEPNNVVKLSDWSVNETERFLTYYMDFCPYGDLDSIYTSYKKSRGEVIPEPVLWYIFLRLAQSCLIMERGDYITSRPGWPQIVHRDIKPPNVFLDVPDPTFFPGYPIPKMADFGFAFETHEDDPTNPRKWYGWGTRGFLAPEQISKIPKLIEPTAPLTSFLNFFTPGARQRQKELEENSIYKMLSHTNVWGIGMVMLELVSGSRLGATAQLAYQNGPDQIPLPAHAFNWYSAELRQMIRACMRYWPNERITAINLYRMIYEQMPRMPGFGQYLREASGGRQPPGGNWGWRLGRESYKLDMVSEQSPDTEMAG
ncbi:Putative serine/threonine-protein kinase, active [Septoria linicola]|uniref:Serine/threonine-protein kinase, active n=1 Tax=Septoria linicola TaxID=215465 RepID=A0A9Q9EK91_9PEZI|nr:Putative serine/threonine-protein kinase, active [Septoria linicola]